MILFTSIILILIMYFLLKRDLLYSITIGFNLYYVCILSFINKPYLNIVISVVITNLLSFVLLLVNSIVNKQVFLAIVIIIYILVPFIISVIKPFTNLSKINELKRELKFFVS